MLNNVKPYLDSDVGDYDCYHEILSFPDKSILRGRKAQLSVSDASSDVFLQGEILGEILSSFLLVKEAEYMLYS